MATLKSLLTCIAENAENNFQCYSGHGAISIFVTGYDISEDDEIIYAKGEVNYIDCDGDTDSSAFKFETQEDEDEDDDESSDDEGSDASDDSKDDGDEG